MKYFILLSFSILFGCSQITLEPTDFAWPIETVLDIDDEGFITESRYSISTNVIDLFYAETNDSTSYRNESVRVIRDTKGYYYMIASGFKNVYQFSASDGKFVLSNKIFVSEFGLDLPAFNQRKPNIELLEGEKHLVFIDSNGIIGEE